MISPLHAFSLTLHTYFSFRICVVSSDFAIQVERQAWNYTEHWCLTPSQWKSYSVTCLASETFPTYFQIDLLSIHIVLKVGLRNKASGDDCCGEAEAGKIHFLVGHIGDKQKYGLPGTGGTLVPHPGLAQ